VTLFPIVLTVDEINVLYHFSEQITKLTGGRAPQRTSSPKLAPRASQMAASTACWRFEVRVKSLIKFWTLLALAELAAIRRLRHERPQLRLGEPIPRPP
jgi:hypothetical protein